ncbi:hypothetical protein PAHAL_5G440800 [Panicum hallii]|uniref:Uncharacterized protein n=1 Tax=Panicum hallii TaxID=206008 RepID=A0A2T8IN75_9POAL|nr:hypothetical protein PAHAL_5G440800 [Panicum hallii]
MEGPVGRPSWSSLSRLRLPDASNPGFQTSRRRRGTRHGEATAAASPGGVYPFQRRSIPAAARPEASPPGARRSPAEAPSGARPRTAEWTVLWSSVWFQV